MNSESSSTTWRLNALLAVLGGVAGAVAAIPLTYLGKFVAGADPASVANYAWNVGAFAIMGAVFGPVLTWSAMRRVPLWRAIVEPAVAGLVGAAAGLLLGSGPGFLVLTAVGVGAATWRLSFVYREKARLPR